MSNAQIEQANIAAAELTEEGRELLAAIEASVKELHEFIAGKKTIVVCAAMIELAGRIIAHPATPADARISLSCLLSDTSAAVSASITSSMDAPAPAADQPQIILPGSKL